MAGSTITTEQSGRVLTVRLHDPPRNLLSGQMLDELDELTRKLARDRSVGAVVLVSDIEGVWVTHADSRDILERSRAVGFAPSYRQARALLRCVGAVSSLPGARAVVDRTPLAGIAELQRADALFLRMNRLDKVFIAAINGIALAGGCVLALACDIRIMAEGDHRIGLVESNLGLIAAAGGTQRAIRLLGPARALDVLLDGRAMSPGEAADIGLVQEVVAADVLRARAHELAERLSRRSPAVVREIKRLVYDAGTRRLRAGIAMEEASMLATASQPDAIKAMEAYHGHVGPFEQASTQAIVNAWDRLHDGHLVEFRR